jgi:hypothetical protein
MANAQKLLLAYGHTLVTTLIPPASGSIITDSVSGGWARAANAFDGNTNQAGAACAAAQGDGAVSGGSLVFIGLDWGVNQAHRITKIVLYGPSNNLLMGSGGATPILFEGSSDSLAWTTLDSFNSGGVNSDVITRTASTIVATTAYRYHRISGVGNGVNGKAIAELQFYRDL